MFEFMVFLIVVVLLYSIVNHCLKSWAHVRIEEDSRQYLVNARFDIKEKMDAYRKHCNIFKSEKEYAEFCNILTSNNKCPDKYNNVRCAYYDVYDAVKKYRLTYDMYVKAYNKRSLDEETYYRIDDEFFRKIYDWSKRINDDFTLTECDRCKVRGDYNRFEENTCRIPSKIRLEYGYYSLCDTCSSHYHKTKGLWVLKPIIIYRSESLILGN